MLDSRSITKVQSIILTAIIVVAAVGGAAYVMLSGEQGSVETIKIGVCADLDNVGGKTVLQGAQLAAEHVNAEGGVLGRNFEVVAEDDDSESGSMDTAFAASAFTRLITVDKADFIISSIFGLVYREIAFEHKKIFFTVSDGMDELAQGVLDNYERYKYFFRTTPNGTSAVEGITDSIVVCRNHTGFNKVAFIYWYGVEPLVSSIIDVLDEHGFDVVLSEPITSSIDFTSAFAKAEAAGAEILYPFIFVSAGTPFVKEYYDRQSPMVMWGNVGIGSRNDFWEVTEGKCEYITNNGFPVVTGYPLTTKTVPTRDAYVERWGEEISGVAANAYDTVRFILADAIRRAGTIETDAVIAALEKTDIETSLCRRFVFTTSHDVQVGEAGPNMLSEEYFFVGLFQWQDGVQVPVYPIELMEEAGAAYLYPPWPGPWD